MSALAKASICAAVAVACLAGAAGARAGTITIGSPLSAPVESEAHCHVATGCSVALTKLAEPGAQASAPVSGAIVRWRVAGATMGDGYSLSALRPLGSGTYLVTGSTAPIAAVGNAVETFAAALPIEAGEVVAVSYPYEAGLASLESPSSEAFFTPPLATGQSRTVAEEGAFPYELGFGAELQPAPTIASLVPSIGPTSGGTAVLITGTDLEGATAVSFGSSAAPSFAVDSETQLTAIAPAGAAGPVAISVTTPAGSATSGGQFTYVTPATAAPSPVSALPPAACTVPKLKGKMLKAAKRALRAADCKLGGVAKIAGATAKSGRVKWQKPRPGTTSGPGTKVSVGLG
jgi:hypothetical protein